MLSTVISKQSVSFEDALRQLAAAVTGAPLSAIPKTQEGAVLYMADYISAGKKTEEPEAEPAAAEEPAAEETEGLALSLEETPAETAEETPAPKKASTAKRTTKKKTSTTT